MIVLTHNFDFYRTIRSGLNSICLMTTKSKNEIKIVPGKYVKDIFSQWKDAFNNNDKILTRLLHLKLDTNTRRIRVADIETIYQSLWQTDKSIHGNDRFVLDILFKQAELICMESDEHLDLENKIVFSIAIRLLAEEYIIFEYIKFGNTT